VPQVGSQNAALELGDKAWARTAEDWTTWREKGLTEHRNWWPEVYRKACESWGVDPDANLIPYSKTYEGTRADQKRLSY